MTVQTAKTGHKLQLCSGLLELQALFMAADQGTSRSARPHFQRLALCAHDTRALIPCGVYKPASGCPHFQASPA